MFDLQNTIQPNNNLAAPPARPLDHATGDQPSSLWKCRKILRKSGKRADDAPFIRGLCQCANQQRFSVLGSAIKVLVDGLYNF